MKQVSNEMSYLQCFIYNDCDAMTVSHRSIGVYELNSLSESRKYHFGAIILRKVSENRGNNVDGLQSILYIYLQHGSTSAVVQ